MAKLSMECKKLMVKEIGDRLNKADMLIVTNYKGLSSQEMDELRRLLREASCEYIVVKDSTVKRAMSGASNSTVLDFIEGEAGLAIDKKKDPTQISGVLTKFSKGHAALNIRGGVMDGAILSMEDIKALAALPSREALLGILANVLNAPIQGLASALSGIIAKLLYALNALKEKKETAKPEEQNKGEKK